MKKLLLKILICFLLLLTGCGSLLRNPVPLQYIRDAQLPDFPNVRTWAGRYSPNFQQDIIESVEQERPEDFPAARDGSKTYPILALSGGGANGAFGAGFLNGWSDAGTRPKFKLVTGISTGSLIAPAAFLGPDYDYILKDSYTKVSKKEIFSVRGLLEIIGSESFAITKPLRKLIAHQMTQEVLEAVAAEHRKGRRLYIGTVNLDAQGLVVWNMGAIADSGHPGSLELFQKIMLASSSIPVVFPPVFFDVEVDGKMYDEMHVDGGTMAQVFLYGFIFDLDGAAKQMNRRIPKHRGTVYVIRNGKLSAVPSHVRRSIFSIAKKASTTMTKMSAFGDLYRIYTIAQRDRLDFNYVAIPDDYEPVSKEEFDPKEMNRLFEVGYEMGKSDQHWRKEPPGLETEGSSD